MRALEVHTPLFGRLPLTPRPRPRRAPRPRPTLPSVVPLEELLHPAGIAIETKDPFHEWRNDWEHPAVARHLTRLPNDYQHSVAWLRANRPSRNGEALRFWLAPLARAHLLNALLMRDDRTLARVQEDVALPRDKLYQYLQRWNVAFEIRRRHVTIEDPDRRQAPGSVLHWRVRTGTAHVRLDGYTTVHEARFDRISRTYRIPDPLPRLDDALLPARAASLLLGVRESELRRIVPPAHRSNAGVNLYHPDTLDAIVPRARWRSSEPRARAGANRCHCTFFDEHKGKCGLRLEPPDPPETCADHDPLPHPAAHPPSTTLTKVLLVLLRHRDALQARQSAPELWVDTPADLHELGVRDGRALPPPLAHALASVTRLLTILGPDRGGELVRIARHAPLLLRARVDEIDAAPPLLTRHRLLRDARLTLRGAAVLNELEAIAARLDAYLC